MALTTSTIFVAATGLLTAYIIQQIIYNRFFHPLRHFPGPFWASVTRLWTVYHMFLSDEHTVEYELHKKHGPVLRIHPNMLLVSDPTKLPEIYTRHVDKSNFYITGSFGDQENIFNMREHKGHAQFRKIAAAPYAFSNVKKMEPLIDNRVSHWLDKISSRFGETGKEFDFAPWAVFMAYDVISEIGFGKPFGFTDAESDVGGLIKAFHDGIVPFGVMARLWPVVDFIKKTPLRKFFVITPEHQNSVGSLMRHRDKVIAQRLEDIKAGNTGHIDLLSRFLETVDGEGKPLTMDHIKAELLLVMVAGADTTGTAFQSMIANILRNERVYNKLMAELDEKTSKGLLSEIPQHDEITQHCPYYLACLKETFRLCPSAVTIFPRLVGPAGLNLYGRFVPPQTEVTSNAWIVHRDEATYGPDAEEFRPERWLEDEEKAKMYSKYSLTFGYGSRVCLGRDIAHMELYKGPLMFLRKFRPIVNKEKPGTFNFKGGSICFWTDMYMKLEKRSGKA